MRASYAVSEQITKHQGREYVDVLLSQCRQLFFLANDTDYKIQLGEIILPPVKFLILQCDKSAHQTSPGRTSYIYTTI